MTNNCSYANTGTIPRDAAFPSGIRSKNVVGCSGKFSTIEANAMTLNDDLRVDQVIDSHNVKYYGAAGDGVTDDTVSIQAAINATDVVFFPEGTYRVTSTLVATKSNTKYYGNGAVLLRDTPDADEALLLITGGDSFLSTTITTAISEGDFTFDVTDASTLQQNDWLLLTSGEAWYPQQGGGDYNKSNLVQVESVTGNTLTLHTPVMVAMDGAAITIGVTAYRPIDNIRVEGLTFQGSTTIPALPPGIGQRGIELKTTSNVTVIDCEFRQFHDAALYSSESFFVDCVNCRFYGVPDGFQMTYALSGDMGYYGHYAFTCYGVNTLGCYAYRIRHITDATRTTNHRTSDCSSVAHHRSMLRLHSQNLNCIMTDNWGFSTIGSGMLNTGTPVKLFANNYLIMTTAPSEAALVSDAPVSTSSFNAGSYLLSNFESTYTGNVFVTSPNNTQPTMVFGNNYSALVVTNNTCKDATVAMDVRSVYVASATIANNHFLCTDGSAAYDGILFTSSAFIGRRDNINIHDNYISGYARSGLRFSASPIPEFRTQRLIVRNNTFDAADSLGSPSIWVGSGYFGSEVYVEDNLVINTAPSGNQIPFLSPPQNFERYPVTKYQISGIAKTVARVQSVVGYSTDSTLAANTTIELNDVLLHTSPAVGESIGWVCRLSGTFGTLVGVTATTDGTTTVTLTGNSASGAGQGAYVVINGSQVRILSLSNDFATAVVSAAIPAVVGTAVSYRAPTMVQFGRVADTVTGYNTNVVGADETVAVDATTITATDGNVQNVAAVLNALKRDLVLHGVISA